MLKVLRMVVYCLLCFSFLFRAQCFASDIFYDSFDIKNEENWNFNENGGEILIDGKLGLYSTTTSFPYVIGKSNISFPESSDFIIEIIFKFPETAGSGVGIGIGYTGVDGENYSQFGFWSDANNGNAFYYNDFYNRTNGCLNFEGVVDLFGRHLIKGINLSASDWNTFKIEKIGSNYKVLINGAFLYQTEDGQCVPKNIWFGNQLRPYVSWSKLEIDSVKIYTSASEPTLTPTPTSTNTPTPTSTNTPTPTPTNTPTPTPTSTPTPTPTLVPTSTPMPTPKHKIIIIPGLGASWNTEAMVYNKEVPNNKWKMTPFVKNYDNLILALKNRGLVENQNFYVWNYDWRRPVAEIVRDLNSFIGRKLKNGEKVDLVGHSLGGLIARVWAQDHLNSPFIGKIISLGSPHFGAVKSYDVWSGAKIGEGFSPENIALNVLIQLQRKNYQTRVETVRNYAPILKDLLPTFDFVKRNSLVIPFSELTTVNQYMKQKNISSSFVFPYFRGMTGIDQPTAEWISLIKRNIIDQSLGMWPDGHPTEWKNGEGDGTVLLKSAVFAGDSSDKVISDHGNLPTVLIGRIFDELGLGVPVGVVSNFDYSNATVFYLGSPATMSLVCGGDVFNMDSMGFVVVGGNYRVCQVNLIGNDGGGEYHLVWGNTSNSNSWNYLEDDIKDGQNKKLIIDMTKGELSLEAGNGAAIYALMNRDLLVLKFNYPKNKNLLSAYEAFKKKNWSLFINKFFGFRKEVKENVVSNRIIGYLRSYLAINEQKIYDKKIATGLYITSDFQIMLMDMFLDKKTSLGLFEALSYEKMKEIHEMMKMDLKRPRPYVAVFDSILISRLAGEMR